MMISTEKESKNLCLLSNDYILGPVLGNRPPHASGVSIVTPILQMQKLFLYTPLISKSDQYWADT